MAVLLLVASGYRPRWTAILHWYVAFGIAASMPVINGGETVVQIITMLLIPACLGDERRWHWARPSRILPGRWRGAAYAAHLTLRVQVTTIYATAGLSKLAASEWRDGTAIAIIADHPVYGFPEAIRQFVESTSWWPWFAGLATWGAVGTEVMVGILIWCGSRVRLGALAIAAVLHTSILLLMGLATFELIMLLLLALVAMDGCRGPRARSHVPGETLHLKQLVLDSPKASR